MIDIQSTTAEIRRGKKEERRRRRNRTKQDAKPVEIRWCAPN